MKKFTQYLNSTQLRESLNDKAVTEVPLVETKLSRVFQYVEDDKKDFGIVSAFRGVNSDKENKARHEELKKAVRAMGYGFIELRGGYKGDEGYVEELSLLIPNITKKGIVDLGRKYEQHSVMYKNDQDFYYIGTNEEAGVGKVLMRFKKGEGQDNLELAKHKVVDFFSQLKKGAHSEKKFVFNVKPDTAKQTAQGKEAEAKVAQRHRPGDIWKTSSGLWGGMDDQGNYEYFDDEQSAKKFSKKHRKGYRIQEREEWNFAKAAYLRRGEDPKWITIYEDSADENA
jgi:hypothetical protein